MENEELKDVGFVDVIKKDGIKNLGKKAHEIVQKKADKMKEKQDIKGQNDFDDIKEEVNSSTSANNWYMMFAPVIGFIIQPAIILLALDIKEEQLQIIKVTLIGSAIGLVLTIFLVMISFKDGINKSVLSVYRHFFTKKEVSDVKVKHIIQENERLKIELENTKTDKEELYQFRLKEAVEQEIKKRSDNK
jgi:hypothetical protein